MAYSAATCSPLDGGQQELQSQAGKCQHKQCYWAELVVGGWSWRRWAESCTWGLAVSWVCVVLTLWSVRRLVSPTDVSAALVLW